MADVRMKKIYKGKVLPELHRQFAYRSFNAGTCSGKNCREHWHWGGRSEQKVAGQFPIRAGFDYGTDGRKNLG